MGRLFLYLCWEASIYAAWRIPDFIPLGEERPVILFAGLGTHTDAAVKLGAARFVADTEMVTAVTALCGFAVVSGWAQAASRIRLARRVSVFIMIFLWLWRE